MRIAVLGGSFDPIHNGHLQIAKTALKKLHIEEVWFMPAQNTPLKQGQSVAFKHRAEMIKRAIRPYRHMRLCTLENEWQDHSYTIRTVKELQKRYPQHEFCWLIGDDQAKQFDEWKDSEILKQRLPFYVFSRDKQSVALPQGLHRITMELKEVSSSDIRKGKHLYEVPKAVMDYIGKNGFYMQEMIKSCMNEHRYIHSQSVAKLCVEFAQAYKLDTTIAYIMGITHDVCKQMPKDVAEVWMKYHLPQNIQEAAAIWHGYVGADFITHAYHVYDRRIKQAVFHHVKGRNKTDYDRILYIADKLDPSRGYDSSKQIEFCKKDLKKGFTYVLAEQKAYLKKTGIFSKE